MSAPGARNFDLNIEKILERWEVRHAMPPSHVARSLWSDSIIRCQPSFAVIGMFRRRKALS